ncbi:Neutral trehalase [Zancudomyces culisetae]|uniref:Trehalase n=1 Tax=Zancudomyces culisetae TaxID=1213189 RepID=A0A1R1PWW2_ZANCU|nr:Neutral trehalase [Zancudomyces culisetae]|eukprot:OMH85485.1 Neutral trehalase [Zancudomyces culisetae]
MTDNRSEMYLPAKEYYKKRLQIQPILDSFERSKSEFPDNKHVRQRRAIDERSLHNRKVLVDIEKTEKLILEQEDTDNDFKITVKDMGPKVIRVPTLGSGGYNKVDIRGTYMLSNLLQEMALAQRLGHKVITIDMERLSENPVDRLIRMIRTEFWDGLIRKMDHMGIERIASDAKDRSTNVETIIYVPYNDLDAYDYYLSMSQEIPRLNLKVVKLPKEITPEYVKGLDKKFGLLTLAGQVGPDGSGKYGPNKRTYDPLPYVVPGGRFNEMYGWDSYFIALGLLIDGRVELAKNMVEHFLYEIEHYGKILNANRSYYLTRSQPPFLTDMVLKVYERLPKTQESKEWLRRALGSAIIEYRTVWMSAPRFDPATGLSCYHTTGIGMPPETEAAHYDHVIKPFADALSISISEYAEKYQSGEVVEPLLDEYFVHDRAVRESGHDTTYRLDKRCANLATVDLNSLLYKYEVDIANIILTQFDDNFVFEGVQETFDTWCNYSKKRKKCVNRYLWNPEKSMYFDYDIKQKCQSEYESVTTLWPLWSGMSSSEQTRLIVENALDKFVVEGGLVSGTLASRGEISLDRPNRQWDYPFGWAPHQIMAWYGLCKYNHHELAAKLAYRWLYTITKSFVDFHGVVPEKFDVVEMSHLVNVEYGNVGVDFKLVATEGFGWMNSSFEIGLQFVTRHMRRALGSLIPPDELFKSIGDGRPTSV